MIQASGPWMSLTKVILSITFPPCNKSNKINLVKFSMMIDCIWTFHSLKRILPYIVKHDCVLFQIEIKCHNRCTLLHLHYQHWLALWICESYCGWSCVCTHNPQCEKLSIWPRLSQMGHALKYIPVKKSWLITNKKN